VGVATRLFEIVPCGESQKKHSCSAAKDQGKKRNEELLENYGKLEN